MAKITYPSCLWLSSVGLSLLVSCQTLKEATAPAAETKPPQKTAETKKKELPPEAQFTVPSASIAGQPAPLPVEAPPAALPSTEPTSQNNSKPREIRGVTSTGAPSKFVIEVADNSPRMATPEEVFGRSFPVAPPPHNNQPPPLPTETPNQFEALPELEEPSGVSTQPESPQVLSSEVDPQAPTMSRRQIAQKRQPDYYGTAVPEKEEPRYSTEHGSDPIISTKRRQSTGSTTSEHQAEETTIERKAPEPTPTPPVEKKATKSKAKKISQPSSRNGRLAS